MIETRGITGRPSRWRSNIRVQDKDGRGEDMALTLIENFRAVFYTPFYAAFALKAYEAEAWRCSG